MIVTALVRRAVTVTVAVGTALTLAVAPASATVSVFSTVSSVNIIGDADNDSITVTCTPAGVLDVGGTTYDPCAGLASVTVDAGAGDDYVTLSALTPAQLPDVGVVNVILGNGTDTLLGSQLRDHVTANGYDSVIGQAGDDYINGAETASGGEGDDLLTGIQQSVDGGPGDDRILQPGSGPLQGGSGADSLELDFTEFDNGTPDLATVRLLINDDELRTQTVSFAQTITASSIETYRLGMFNTSRDTVDSRTYTGSVQVRTLALADVLRGGPGDDLLDAGRDDDVVDGGGGFDRLLGGEGDDTLTSRDGGADRVDCGPGVDTVVADRSDVLSGCENVQLPAPVTGRVSGPKKITQGAKASYTFSSSVAGSTFQCQVDTKAWKTCRSPYKLATKKLKPGKHTLRVRAVAGSVDATPSVLKIKVAAR